MTASQNHNVSVRVGDTVIDRWQSYEIASDMLTPADAFSLTLSPALPEAIALVPPDGQVEVRVDDVAIVTGFIDDRNIDIDRSGSQLAISGRDKTGRMVDESASLQTFGSLSLQTLLLLLASPQFVDVRLDNKLNRDLVRGRRSGKAPSGSEPLFAKKSEAPRKVEPGEARWDIAQALLKPARLLAWSAADGSALVVGLPNYSQATQFRFFVPREGSTRLPEGNVIKVGLVDSVANRYSKITVVGASRGDSAKYGTQVTKHRATVLQGPNPDGTGDAFTTRKQLILADDDVKNSRDARERARRELALRDAEKRVVEIVVKGHSQARNPGEIPAVFAFDTMAELEIEGILKERFLITSVQFAVSRDGGEISTLKLVPEGTELVS
jgi:prophage tail gpP-like protein